jgi:hypothetical protein
MTNSPSKIAIAAGILLAFGVALCFAYEPPTPRGSATQLKTVPQTQEHQEVVPQIVQPNQPAQAEPIKEEKKEPPRGSATQPKTAQQAQQEPQPLLLPLPIQEVAPQTVQPKQPAQTEPLKLAVYVSGASDAGINKSLSNKLLVVMSQSGEYAEIADPGYFQDELAKSGKSDIAQISQTAKRHGADYVCVVSMTEVLGAYSITARLIKIAGSQVIKTGSTDRQLKSLEDLTAISNELARQLLPPSAILPAVSAIPLVVQPSTAPMPAVIDRVAAARKQCSKTYNINELLFNLKENFPNQLKDCASKLAKDMLTPAVLGGKKLGEPKSFMKECTIDGIRDEIPDGFPNANKIVGSVDNFVQGILNSASAAGGGLDPKKLIDAVGSVSVSINTLLSDVKKLSSNRCVVNEPYEPPVAFNNWNDDENYSNEEKSSFSFGLRGGLNSHFGRGNFHIGMVFDIPLGDVLHLQPGFMFIQKTSYSYDYDCYYYDDCEHYGNQNLFELPLLLSFKFGVFRVNTGVYAALPDMDIGLSEGAGFDIGMFYIGTFYEYGFVSGSSTLGSSLGINF